MFRNYHADISDLEWSGTHYQKGLFGVKWPYGEDEVLPSAIQPHMKYLHSKTNPWKQKRIVSCTCKKKNQSE